MQKHLITLLLAFVAGSSLAASQVHAGRVRVSQGVMSGMIDKKVEPVYPPLARQAHIQGTVILRAQINKTGDVVNLQLVSGHPMLAPAAIDAVKQWKYRPFLLNGEPVDVETDITVNFTLSGKLPAEGAPDDAGAASNGEIRGGVIGVASNPGDPVHPPQRIRVSSGVLQGLVLSKVQPEYPADAKDQRIQGEVRLQVTIDKEGNVANIQLISGHPSLAPAAIDAVKQWKYRPYLLNGNPLEVLSQVVVNFTLAE
jgi:TonB family protein